jgi:hypothetical protein
MDNSVCHAYIIFKHWLHVLTNLNLPQFIFESISFNAVYNIISFNPYIKYRSKYFKHVLILFFKTIYTFCT